MGLVVYCHLNGTEDELGNVVARVVLTADMEGKRVLAIESKTIKLGYRWIYIIKSL